MKAEVEFIEIYAAIASNDSDWSGPHHSWECGYASTEMGAKILAKGQGGWGSDGSVKKRSAIRINGKVYLNGGELDLDNRVEEKKEKLKKKALEKLSPEEREVLNIKA